MVENIEKIRLYAETHAIEVANFVVNLALPIDRADERRFEEHIGDVKKIFPAINTGEIFQFALGGPPPSNVKLPEPVPTRELTFFGNDGKPQWTGSFGESRVIVSCRRYTGWDDVWPDAKARLETLLGCLDQYKPVRSIEYSVTDTFNADKADDVLIPPNMFQDNDLVPRHILQLKDPRWDFNQGWFQAIDDEDQVLVRIEGRSAIQNNLVVASIGNLHSQRFGRQVSVGDAYDPNGAESVLSQTFDSFHDKNKELLRSTLTDDLQTRMGLKG
ncbi:TIGR04255 family protein [Aquicoccus porphyridii]|uniref:TIGR04255 family protein n=1 Tax=Aquicoccus porphyridii TaxID=1852029 RepID=A0A5A9YX39_9RHOB|nr:TIGR04255 family protein [Aquicoccus porphyridii]KAA0909532.1 TIGR04255 family protein [Aquicoccus porphyridii]RAI51810.1 hypothetical protein DOO74_21220 [Rhodobacteraceae bacterium AsT-22]